MVFNRVQTQQTSHRKGRHRVHSSLSLPTGLARAGAGGTLAGASPAPSARLCKQGAERAGENPKTAPGCRLQLEHRLLKPLHHRSGNGSAALRTPATLPACSQAILRRGRGHTLPVTWLGMNPVCLVSSEETPAGCQASREFVSVWAAPVKHTGKHQQQWWSRV